ncbi:hypothetical protein F0P96_12695 [Hymenobacter busanensis]|uniref:Uncharacterized protein n=1 Tax=Hymenobacter busanensis TaxID=2607656 RepID=A0A7L4ZWF0_9BACT|nr:hypothetical protein [Hymenobacter busanensis]KAA9332330.1 hypothetical protein F0P96_12695 [Hymenobacter busanensis]QHJ07333.1 hypothetical protein GUY19_08580 [Hymenobacter busanensis]
MKNKAPHILNTSSNLLGLCFIVLTSLRVTNRSTATFIDELTAVAALFFISSSILSFLSMRDSTPRSAAYERVADGVFLIGLVFIFLTAMLIAFNVVG